MKSTSTRKPRATHRSNGQPQKSKPGQDPVLEIAIGQIRPSPENDRLYKPVDPSHPDIIGLAESIKKHGVKEPLVLTADDWILSGHRRYAAAKLAGRRTVPCRIEPIRREDDIDRFIVLLREYNRQREKSRAEKHSAAGFADGRQSMERPIFRTALAELAHQQQTA